jgi:hypothetical protein
VAGNVIDCPADLGPIQADQTRFRQSLLNLANSRSEALRAALNLLKCPNWTHDMWLRLDEPSGQSLGTDDASAPSATSAASKP